MKRSIGLKTGVTGHKKSSAWYCICGAFLLAMALLGGEGNAQNKYNSTFPTIENPLSESGNWVNGGIGGFTNCQTLAANKVVSTQTSGSGFTDATCVLKGTWGVNQTVTATFHTTNAIEENELRALTTITNGGSITGYEFNCSSGYVEIVRWDGGHPLNFVVLIHDGAHGCANNNPIKATTDAAGNLRFFINNVQTTTIVDTTYKTGAPGLGMNTFLASGGVNSDHWLSDFTATDGVNRAWAGIIDPSRAIDWTKAGLPATLPDGETTVNPWTPPTRTQCGSTIASGAAVATINTALAACPAGTFVLLGPGTFTVNNTQLRLADTSGGTSHSGTSLRGSGPNSTKIVLTGSAVIAYGNAWSSGAGTWTSGFSQGGTSLGLSLTSGSAPSIGQIIAVSQCDTGQTGAGCTGTRTDNNGVYLCGGTTSCANQAGNDTLQSQTLLVTNVVNTGGSNYTVTFSPGLYMPNWAAQGGGAFVTWTGAGSVATPSGIGLESLTVDMTGISGIFGIQFSNVYASWMKGVRVVGTGSAEAVSMSQTKNSLFFSNYIDDYSYTLNSLSLSLQVGRDSDDLIGNNIFKGGLSFEGLGSNEGLVISHNLATQTHTLYNEANMFQHTPGCAFTLYEGNQSGQITDDDTWGSCNLDTFFRNYLSGWDPPYLLPISCSSDSCNGLKIDGVHRFANIFGNVIGSQFVTNYEANLSTPLNGITNNSAYRWSADTNDPLTKTTAMRWGNCDSATGTCRNQSSEVPTTLSGNAAPFQNLIPVNNTLPSSLYLPAGTPSWWKVCTTWSSFPTTCSVTQTQPFPSSGPDVSGGPYVSGHAYDNPAALIFNGTTSLPIDPTYQNPYTVTGYSWSGGTETITVTGLPTNSAHIMGGFQISGATGTCNSSAGAEFVMTGSSPVPTNAGPTTITYLTSNPGACSGGSMKFPDVRQFDERVFGATASASPFVSLSPSSLTFSSFTVGVTSASQPVTLSNIGGAALSITSITASGDFAQSNNCPASLGISLSCTIDVTFTPTTAGVRSGTLSVVDNASGSPHTVSLSGTGVAPVIFRPTAFTDSSDTPVSNPAFAYDGDTTTKASAASGNDGVNVTFYSIAYKGFPSNTGTGTLYVLSDVTNSAAGLSSADYSLDAGAHWTNIWSAVNHGGSNSPVLDSVNLPSNQDFSQVQVRFVNSGCGPPTPCSVSAQFYEVWIQTQTSLSQFSGTMVGTIQ